MPIVFSDKKTDSKPFNFDLERMKKAVEAPTHRMPNNLTFNEFQKWMKKKTAKA